MYWFRRPPYLRWAAATLIVLAVAYTELRGPATVEHPFVAEATPAGMPLAAVEWRDVPAGLLPDVDIADRTAARRLEAGEPVLPSSLGGEMTVPDGWWSVPVSLPVAGGPGTEVLLVVLTPDGIAADTVPGRVVTPGGEDTFGAPTPGLVAVPGEAAGAVAGAAAFDRVVVLTAPSGGG